MKTIALSELKVTDFAALEHGEFELARDDASPEVLSLVEAMALREGEEKAGRRAPFSLLFQAAAECRLPQGIYSLTHPELGTLDLFLVPMQPDERGTLYEAVFN